LPDVPLVVRRLTRARRARHLLDHVWGGLFWSLLLASAAMLAIRVQSLPLSLAAVVSSLLAAGVAVAALMAWRTRPGELDTAIRADLHLRLKQQLSTAWEFLQSEPDSPRTQRLVARAVRARLPARAELVFPLTLNLWGRLLPAAALLAVLVAIVELPQPPAPVQAVADPLLRQEGERLRDYARAMQQRARSAALPRSQDRAAEMEQLGARMENADLDRREALSRLRDLGEALDADRRAALSRGREIRRDDLRFRSVQGTPGAAALDLQALLERLMNGELGESELGSLTEPGGALSQLGVTPEALEQALRSLAQGRSQPLQDLLQRLGELQREGADAGELAGAGERLQRSRETLGDAGETGAESSARQGGDDASDDGSGMDEVPFASGDAAGREVPGAGAARPGSGGRGVRAVEPVDAGELPPPPPPTAIVQPRSSPGEGEVFVSRARVLPRSAPQVAAPPRLDPDYQAQVEAVLSQQQVPLQQRELVRRYFLNLTQEPQR
jgi:hypothetical protein